MSGDGNHVVGMQRQPLRLADLADATARVKRAEQPAQKPTTKEQEAVARREFAVLLGEFRRTAVLVPLDGAGGLWSAERGGVRWIYAFRGEAALARFALAKGEGAREWEYRSVLGARLLDVTVPAVGVPCGVALDVGGEDGVLFPPVAGIVPEAAAVDAGAYGEGMA